MDVVIRADAIRRGRHEAAKALLAALLAPSPQLRSALPSLGWWGAIFSEAALPARAELGVVLQYPVVAVCSSRTFSNARGV